ncbi:MAG: hypothetical protein KAH38_04270, partial [Candidatus Hydrogenedentes bacterium]|nr:hypothetical protein [Candidatus Hydrogenedentota bacterium]
GYRTPAEVFKLQWLRFEFEPALLYLERAFKMGVWIDRYLYCKREWRMFWALYIFRETMRPFEICISAMFVL